MISQTAIDHVHAAVEGELKHANDMFPMFASAHETYAVILEEVQEAEDAIKLCKKYLSEFWDATKLNDPTALAMKCEVLRSAARSVIFEGVQVAAMADKGALSLEALGENNE
jgi:hypothetical protein